MKKRVKKLVKSATTVSKGRLPLNKLAGGLKLSEKQTLNLTKGSVPKSGGGSGGKEMERYAQKRMSQVRRNRLA